MISCPHSRGYPPLIRYLQLTILILSVLAAFWGSLFSSGHVSMPPSILLLNNELSLKTLLSFFTAPLHLSYPEISFTLLFDLVVINALITPMYTFVLSFIGTRSFVGFITILTFIGTTAFLFFAPFWITQPISLFSSLTLSIVLFWVMQHSKGQSFFLLAFPISPFVYLAIATVATIYPICVEGEWAKLCATAIMACTSYFFAVIHFHLRSNFLFLKPFENLLDNSVSRLPNLFRRR
jgi:hypothetical protein